MASTSDFKVIVIGAGPTGLLLAQGLKQHAIKCTVYEREDPTTYQKRPRDWGMTIHWSAEYISTCLPLELRSKLFERVSCDPYFDGEHTGPPIYNSETGEKLFEMRAVEPRRVSRRKLRNFLSQGIDVQYGKKITSITPSHEHTVRATFADNTTTIGTVLVGCDGANSTVRSLLVGPTAAKTKDIDIQMFNFTCRFPTATAIYLRQSFHPIYKIGYNPNSFMMMNSIQDVPKPDSAPESWLFQNVLSWAGTPRPEDLPDQASRMKLFKERCEGCAEPWKTIGRDVPEDTVLPVDTTRVWSPDVDWSKGYGFGTRVTLAGDAAHAFPPFRGQGLNNALEDAAKLFTELVAVNEGRKSLKNGIEAYETEMKERAINEMDLSMKQAGVVHNWETLRESPFFKHGMNKYKEEQQAKTG